MIELDHDEIITAIGYYLEAAGASADLGTVKLEIGARGLVARMEGERAETDDDASDARGSDHLSHDQMLGLCDRLETAKVHASPARSQMVAVDSFSGEELQQGEELLWISGYGVTRAPLEKWPDELRKKLGLEEKPESEAQTAADILGGGDEGPIDRGDALSAGLKKGNV